MFRGVPMNQKQYIKAIVIGSEIYFRTFALADNMYHHDGAIEWIVPLPGEKGPAIVYKVECSAMVEEEIDRLIPDIQAGIVPSLWVLTPCSQPEKVSDILIKKGFKDITDREHPEYGMAMDMDVLADLPQSSKMVEIREVESISEFSTWVNVVNEALHGWELLTTEHYCIWLEREEYTFYLGFLNGIPVCTAATIKDGSKASLEFVSTLKEYRKNGVAYAVCLKALQELHKNGVEIVTLRSSFEAIKLYEKLGFKPYYEQQLFSFQEA